MIRNTLKKLCAMLFLLFGFSAPSAAMEENESLEWVTYTITYQDGNSRTLVLPKKMKLICQDNNEVFVQIETAFKIPAVKNVAKYLPYDVEDDPSEIGVRLKEVTSEAFLEVLPFLEALGTDRESECSDLFEALSIDKCQVFKESLRKLGLLNYSLSKGLIE